MMNRGISNPNAADEALPLRQRIPANAITLYNQDETNVKDSKRPSAGSNMPPPSGLIIK